MDAAARESAVSSRPVMMTEAPSAASESAMASPMPREAPVIRAMRSFSFPGADLEDCFVGTGILYGGEQAARTPPRQLASRVRRGARKPLGTTFLEAVAVAIADEGEEFFARL